MMGNTVTVPVTLVVGGRVLSGNKGPTLYPTDSLAATVQLWDGIPVTYGHPSTDGMTAVRETPHLIVGKLRKPRMRGNKLTALAEVDLKALGNLDPDLAVAVRTGAKAEVSLGAYSAIEYAQGMAMGARYNCIARDLEPDHLALIPAGRKGACSLADGCGLNVNEAADECACNCAECRGTANEKAGDRMGRALIRYGRDRVMLVSDEESINELIANMREDAPDVEIREVEVHEVDEPVENSAPTNNFGAQGGPPHVTVSWDQMIGKSVTGVPALGPPTGLGLLLANEQAERMVRNAALRGVEKEQLAAPAKQDGIPVLASVTAADYHWRK